MTNRQRANVGRGARLLGPLALTTAITLIAGCSLLPTHASEDSSPSPEQTPAIRIALIAPDSLGGLPKSLNRGLTVHAKTTLDALKPEVGTLTSAIGWAYGGETETQDAILVSAAAGKLTNPRTSLNRYLTTMTPLSDTHPVEPGPLGGEARCGAGDAGGERVAFCGWADQDSIGILLFLSDTFRDRSSELATLRGQLEQPVATSSQPRTSPN
jgi:hypothetical protein